MHEGLDKAGVEVAMQGRLNRNGPETLSWLCETDGHSFSVVSTLKHVSDKNALKY